jgi:CheY-like chemotaxis protein
MGMMRAQLGPIPSANVLAWVTNARQVLDGVERAGAALPVELPTAVAAAFRGYLDAWEGVARAGDPFSWSAEVDVEEVRHLIVYLFGVLTLDDETWDRHGLPWAPPEAEPFYDALVAAVTEGLAEADAEVGPMLEASWPEELTRTRAEPDGAPRRIVIVDDTADVRLLFEMALTIDGRFEVVGMAQDGAEGIQVCEALQPDGVLLDVMMPVMDGLTALPRLRAACPGARIVVLSADDRPELVREAMAAGADAYVTKSASVDDAIDALLAAADR